MEKGQTLAQIPAGAAITAGSGVWSNSKEHVDISSNRRLQPTAFLATVAANPL